MSSPVADTDTDEDGVTVEQISEWPIEPTRTMLGKEAKVLKRHISHEESNDIHCMCTKKRFSATESEQLASISVAHRWRKQPASLKDGCCLPKSNHPNTLLSAIFRLPITKEFLGSEIKRLRNKLQWCDTADVHAALGSFLEKDKKFVEARESLQKAIDRCDHRSSDGREYKWLLHRVNKQERIRQEQCNKLQRLDNGGVSNDCLPLSTEVDRVPYSALMLEDFYNKYACTCTPVIITGLLPHMTSCTWTLQHIQSIAGDCGVPLKQVVQDSSEWAQLEDSTHSTVRSYIDGVLSGSETMSYLFDWSLPINCPKLASELTIPKYFANDFLQRSSPGSLYKDSWPSLFIAPAGLYSELHVDAFGSNFWMALFQGKKRWTFFPKSDLALLYPRYEHSMDPVFDVDLSKPDLQQHPLLSLTNPIQCVLSEGEVLFVPAGCPHRVENLTTSLAISANFVDQSNFGLVKDELGKQALVDPRSEDLLKQFTASYLNSDMDFSIDHLSWQDFKFSKPPHNTCTPTQNNDVS